MEKHNHGPNWGVYVDGCPRCEELRLHPYVLKFHVAGDRKRQVVPVATVRAAVEYLQARLDAEPGFTIVGVPVVETPGVRTVAILRIF